jgi:hypothetical protein
MHLATLYETAAFDADMCRGVVWVLGAEDEETGSAAVLGCGGALHHARCLLLPLCPRPQQEARTCYSAVCSGAEAGGMLLLQAEVGGMVPP